MYIFNISLVPKILGQLRRVGDGHNDYLNALPCHLDFAYFLAVCHVAGKGSVHINLSLKLLDEYNNAQ